MLFLQGILALSGCLMAVLTALPPRTVRQKMLGILIALYAQHSEMHDAEDVVAEAAEAERRAFERYGSVDVVRYKCVITEEVGKIRRSLQGK